MASFDITQRYSGAMAQFQPLPNLWLLSDQRNDDRLEAALERLPPGSGFIYRHYHLAEEERRRRFDTLKQVANAQDHCVILSGNADQAGEWGAHGVYGVPGQLGHAGGLLRLTSAHNAIEIEAAEREHPDAILLSPVFATRTHPDSAILGLMGFHILAQQCCCPVIALGGMNAERAQLLDWPRWAAIDGLS